MSPETQVAIWSGIAGAVIGGALTFLSAIIIQKNANKQSKELQEKLLENQCKLQKEQLEYQARENQKQLRKSFYDQRVHIYREITDNLTELHSHAMWVATLRSHNQQEGLYLFLNKFIPISYLLPQNVFDEIRKSIKNIYEFLQKEKPTDIGVIQNTVSHECAKITAAFRTDLDNLKETFLNNFGG